VKLLHSAICFKDELQASVCVVKFAELKLPLCQYHREIYARLNKRAAAAEEAEKHFSTPLQSSFALKASAVRI